MALCNCLIAVIALFPTPDSKNEPTTFKMKTVADGEVSVLIDQDSRLPIAVADDRAEVTTAALAIVKLEGPVSYTWLYSIRLKTGIRVTSVRIEDETQRLQTLLHDDNPKVQSNFWRGSERVRELTKDDFEFMNEKDPWMLLRRITITYEDGGQSKLHQLVVQTQRMRVDLLRKLMEEQKAGKSALSLDSKFFITSDLDSPILIWFCV
jgi:hypothetical protein